MRILLLCFVSLAFSPSSISEDEKKCFFHVARLSNWESSERQGGMKVSVGSCTAKLFTAEELMVTNPSRQYYGAFDDLDLIITRGSAYYRRNPDHADEMKSNILICEQHVRELGHYWNIFSGHIRHHKTTKGNVLACSYPIEPHNRHIDRKGTAFYLTREEAKSFLKATGIHLHIGLPLCKDHHEMIISRIQEAKEEICDKSYAGQEDVTMEEEKRDQTALQNAFFSFCQEADIDRVCPKLSFADYTRDTQTRKIRNIERIFWTSLELVVPGFETEVWHRVCKTGQYQKWNDFGREAAGLILPQIAHLYMLADDARTRDIILSQAAGPLTYAQLLPYFPGLSSYKFTNAKRIWATQEIPPEVKNTKTRWSDENSMYFVFYLASPHLMTTMPSGIRKAKLSTGEKVDIPNVIRNFGQADIIRNYRAFMEAQGLGDKVYSDSTMIRMLRVCPATQRHSLTCVDSFKAASYEAFDGVEEMIDRIVRMNKMDKEEGKDQWFEFLEIRLYLKHDFGLHVKEDSRVADHSLLFALSDPYNHKFAVTPTHPHDLQCVRCIHIDKTFRKLNDFISSLMLSDPRNEREYREMIFNLRNFWDAISQLKSHVLRSVYTNLVKQWIIEHLPVGHAFITLDYGQKAMPTKCYETQCDYFAKKGLPWHFSHVNANISNTLVQHMAIHMVVDDKQDSRSTVSIVTALLKELKIAGIKAVHIRSDNAANYHCAPTLGSIVSISKETGVEILDWSFSEIQDGKGPSDRGCANAKFKVRKAVNNKATVQSQKDLFDILTKAPLMPGVSIYLAEVSDPATEPPASVINRVTDYSHFKKEGDKLRVWKYWRIGEGEVFSKLYSNAGVYKELHRGGFLANSSTEAMDSELIRNRQPATFWHYDPKALETKEPGDRDQDTAVEVEPETKDGKKGIAFACSCGSTFLQYGNYLNHLDYGVHKSHPLKTTNADETLKLYKSCLEDIVQVRSLVPLQDAIDAVFDKTAPVLAMGWGLRSAKKHGRYPEKTRKFIQDFAVERRKQGKRADPEEAFKRMISEPSIDLDERMTREQIKRYINRLVLTPVTKKKTVVRGRRSDVEMEEEVEWIVTEVEEGEWEIEEECETNDEDDFDRFFYHFKKNEDGIFEN